MKGTVLLGKKPLLDFSCSLEEYKDSFLDEIDLIFRDTIKKRLEIVDSFVNSSYGIEVKIVSLRIKDCEELSFKEISSVVKALKLNGFNFKKI